MEFETDDLTQPIFDISPIISSRLGVFPGDTPFTRKILLDYSSGDHLRLSALSTTLHIGAHADAPRHYISDPDAKDIASAELHAYLGPCEVVWADVPRGERVRLEHLRPGFKPRAPRLLVQTGSFPDPEKWNSDFSSISPELIDWLSNEGVRLIGIDTPSIDPETSVELSAHAAVARCDMRILEGLILSHIPEGTYTLIALPLRLEGADASPVRAILLPLGQPSEERID